MTVWAHGPGIFCIFGSTKMKRPRSEWDWGKSVVLILLQSAQGFIRYYKISSKEDSVTHKTLEGIKLKHALLQLSFVLTLLFFPLLDLLL